MTVANQKAELGPGCRFSHPTPASCALPSAQGWPTQDSFQTELSSQTCPTFREELSIADKLWMVFAFSSWGYVVGGHNFLFHGVWCLHLAKFNGSHCWCSVFNRSSPKASDRAPDVISSIAVTLLAEQQQPKFGQGLGQHLCLGGDPQGTTCQILLYMCQFTPVLISVSFFFPLCRQCSQSSSASASL